MQTSTEIIQEAVYLPQHCIAFAIHICYLHFLSNIKKLCKRPAEPPADVNGFLAFAVHRKTTPAESEEEDDDKASEEEEESDSEEESELDDSYLASVEKILDVRTDKNGTEKFFVKFKGVWPHTCSFWVVDDQGQCPYNGNRNSSLCCSKFFPEFHWC